MSFHLFIFWGDYFATHFLVAIGDKQLRSQQARRWHLFPVQCRMQHGKLVLIFHLSETEISLCILRFLFPFCVY